MKAQWFPCTLLTDCAGNLKLCLQSTVWEIEGQLYLEQLYTAADPFITQFPVGGLQMVRTDVPTMKDGTCHL